MWRSKTKISSKRKKGGGQVKRVRCREEVEIGMEEGKKRKV